MVRGHIYEKSSTNFRKKNLGRTLTYEKLTTNMRFQKNLMKNLGNHKIAFVH